MSDDYLGGLVFMLTHTHKSFPSSVVKDIFSVVGSLSLLEGLSGTVCRRHDESFVCITPGDVNFRVGDV